MAELTGYLRADGRKGVRDVVVVVYLVECAHHVAREIVYPFREAGCHLIGFPGCYPNAYAHRMLDALCTCSRRPSKSQPDDYPAAKNSATGSSS